MRSKIKLSGDPIIDLDILFKSCTNNNQICYHIKKNDYILKYMNIITGLDLPVMESFYHYKEGIKEIPKCICGKDRKYHCNGYRPTCSDKKCQSIVRENSKKKFCIKNYGVEFVTQLDSMKENSKKTLMERYGVDNITKLPEIIKKRKKSNLIKHGVSDPIMLKSVRGDEGKRGIEKIQSGLPDGYIVLESDQKYYYKIICEKGHEFIKGKSELCSKKKNNIEICNQCNEYIGSNGEQDLYNYISSIYEGNISRSNRTIIKPLEIDIVIDELKLCIEFNGDYWHSEKIKDQYYHLNKLNMCRLKGYKLIQIRENDWNKNKEEIQKKLYNLINDIFDITDFNINNDELEIDLSWFDDRILEKMNFILEDTKLPQLIKVGQLNQWDCGYIKYKLLTILN
jgi:very-short-patch-repair endonuclease